MISRSTEMDDKNCQQMFLEKKNKLKTLFYGL